MGRPAILCQKHKAWINALIIVPFIQGTNKSYTVKVRTLFVLLAVLVICPLMTAQVIIDQPVPGAVNQIKPETARQNIRPQNPAVPVGDKSPTPLPAQWVPLHIQDFETTMAPWTHSNGQAFPFGWGRQAATIHPGWAPPNPGSWCLWIDSDATGEIGTSDFAVSPPITATGYYPLRVRWGIGYDDFYNPGVDYCQMQYRIHTSGTWCSWAAGRTYQTDALKQDSIDITGPCDSVQLRFFYTDGDVMPCAWAAIDNVDVFGSYTGVEGQPAEPAAPEAVSLSQICPNPFRQSTIISYQHPRAGQVSLKVYNIAGQLVRTLVNGTRPAGAQQARWDGRDDRDRKIAAGVYVCRLDAEGTNATRKLVHVK